jgi:hypothetical protein
MDPDIEVSTAAYYETAVYDLLRRFGPDTQRVVEIAIARLEDTGPESALAIWRELQITLLRTSPLAVSDTLQ